jgi:hypothetical protein
MITAANALTAIIPLHTAQLMDAFTFVINGMSGHTTTSDASLISPAVALQLSTDARAREFIPEDRTIDAAAILIFRSLLADAVWGVPSFDCARVSLSLLFRLLWNPTVERLCFFPGPLSRLPFPSDSISLLSVEAVDFVLSNRTFCLDKQYSLFELFVCLGSDDVPILPPVQWNHLSQDRPPSFPQIGPDESVWPGLSHFLALHLSRPPVGLASLIVADFPDLFAEFIRHGFTLRWGGSGDGFLVCDFQGHCEGQANTLPLIEDTMGNIFGGFTPVEWESRA